MHAPAALRHPAYIPEIDSLRALAVIAVMLYHLSHAVLPGGFFGVDVFFVISGYVVSSSLTSAQGKARGMDPKVRAADVASRASRARPSRVVSAIDVGGPLFFDGDHLTAFGNRVLYPSFAAVIERIGAAEAH